MRLILSLSSFFQGLCLIVFSILITYLEFYIPPKLFNFCSSFFSFLGRGIIYILLAALVAHTSTIRYFCGLYIFGFGLLYIVYQYNNSIIPPTNMQGEPGLSTDDLDDVI
ncbi:hypothetical protein B5S29_g2331 [[Candida] boidinii]|nr:hypothetical protein B5S29_g2331 [[Candida] boidinii]